MPTVTTTSFRIRFPEFADDVVYPDALVDLVIQEAAQRVSRSVFGDLYDAAHGFMAAHLLMSTPTGSGFTGAGEIQSITAGQASITYRSGAASSASASNISSTNYGREFHALARIVTGSQAVI